MTTIDDNTDKSPKCSLHPETFGLPCAWCGSRETDFRAVINWDEDQWGNHILTNDIDDRYEPKEESWHCANCDDRFIVPLVWDWD